MDPTTIILGRLDVLERHREADRAEAKKDRHDFRNEMATLYNNQAVEIIKLQRAQNGNSAKAENKWMRWVMVAQGSIIGFLAWLVWGHK